MYRLLLTVGMTCTLASCVLIEDRSERYQQAERGQALELPEGMSRSAVKERYPVPNASGAFVPGGKFEVPEPPSPSRDLDRDQFSIRNAGDDLWLSVTEAPGRIWPALINWAETEGVEILERDGGRGRLQGELSPNSLRARGVLEAMQLPPQDRYRFLLTVGQGIRKNSSEIRVTQLNASAEADPAAVSASGTAGRSTDVMGQGAPGATETVSATDEQQQTFRRKMLAHLQGWMTEHTDRLESYSLAAQGLSGRSLARLDREAGSPTLVLELTPERAWVAVGEALQAARIPIVDLNQSRAEYLVQYQREAGKAGSLLDWWKTADSRALLSDDYNFTLQLQDTEGEVRVQANPRDAKGSAQRTAALLNAILENLD